MPCKYNKVGIMADSIYDKTTTKMIGVTWYKKRYWLGFWAYDDAITYNISVTSEMNMMDVNITLLTVYKLIGKDLIPILRSSGFETPITIIDIDDLSDKGVYIVRFICRETEKEYIG
jgi:hypothetical protein